MLSFRYQVLRLEKKEVVAEGETRHLILDSKGKPKSLPEEFAKCLVG
jgi:acyl-CoA thioesterase FadM